MMSDSDEVYVSKMFAKACHNHGLWHIRTRPITPRTNRKAGGFIKTICMEWAYAMAYPNLEERNRWPTSYLAIFIHLNKNWALVWRSQQQRLV